MSVIEAPIEVEETPEEIQEIDPATEILIRAKAYLQEHGWIQLLFHAPTGEVCVMQSVIIGATPSTSIHHHEAIIRLSRAIGTQDMISWNDAPGRKLEDVYDALDRAIGA